MTKFSLEISANNCKYEIRVNDFPALFDSEGYQLNTIAPINHLLFSDSLILEINISPIENQPQLNQIASFTLRLFSTHADSLNEKTIFDYKSDFKSTPTPSVQIQKLFPIKSIENDLSWVNGERLKINEQTLQLLNQKYQNIWKLFKTKDLNQLAKEIELREIAYSTSYGTSLQSRLNESISAYESYMNNAEFELFDLKLSYFDFKLACSGKLIYMEDQEGFHPVFYLKKNRRGSISIPLYFSMLAGELKITL